jgi:hypothetical protein
VSGPIKTWTAAAKVLGMCDDTLRAHCRKYGDKTVQPWWEDAAAVKAWYKAMITPRERPVARQRRVRPVAQPERAADVDALVRELTGG